MKNDIEAWKVYAKAMLKTKKGFGAINFFTQLMIGIFVVVLLAFILAIAGANLKDTTSDTTAEALIDNFTAAIGTLGTSVSTWLILGGLIVLVGIMVVVIVLIQRVQGGGGGTAGAL